MCGVCYNIIVPGRIFFQNKFHFRINRGEGGFFHETFNNNYPGKAQDCRQRKYVKDYNRQR